MSVGVYIKTAEHRRNLSKALTGKKLSEETKKKISEAQKGVKKPAISLSNRTRIFTEETRRKMSLARKGKKRPKEFCENYKGEGNPFYGKKHSEETKLKISEANSDSERLTTRGEKNSRWKGGDIKYRGLHGWVQRWLGQPDTCEHCGKSNLSGHLIHWANKSHEYKRDLSDWLRLCVNCHKAYDCRRKTG